MAALVFMESRIWLAAGWLMLHFLWVGGAIGLVAIGGRRLLRPANAKQRYAFALGCLLALATAPLLIALFLVPATPVASANERASTEAPSLSFPANNLPNTIGPPAVPAMAREATITERIEAAPASTVSNRIKASVLTRIAFYLPWVWLIGAPITFLLVGTGLIGAERLRRHSVLIPEGDLPSQCRRLGIALGIIRHVGVGICERLAGPILIGMLRPVILLPPAALTGWSVAQLEMVLVHELAHVRRWDSLANLLQRIVEALLFFHPAVWWVSAWIRLEREMCCDQVVVAHTGKPMAYAQTLAALALPNLPMNPVLAMAESNLVPRIRRILNLEDRSMKVSPKVLGLSAALVVGVGVILGLYAQEADPKSVQPDGGKTASSLEGQETSKDSIPAQKEKEKTQKTQGSSSGKLPPEIRIGQDIEITVKPKRQTLHAAMRVPGNVEAFEQVLYPKVTGFVEKVHGKIGDRVKKGQVLAELSVPELEADVARKRAGIVQAEAQVEQAERSVRTAQVTLKSVMVQVPVAEAGIKAAQADFQFKSKELERYKTLAAQKAIDKSLLDEGAAKLEAAKANLVASEGKLNAAQATVAEMEAKLEQAGADVKLARAGLEVAQADRNRALQLVDFSIIRSPIDGLISHQTAVPGGLAQPPQRAAEEPLFVVVRIDSIRVVALFSEDVIAWLTKDTKLTVRIGQQEFKTKIARLGGVLDPASRTLRAEMELPNPDEKLKPGTYAEVSVDVERPNVWTLPTVSVRGDIPYCFRIENGKAIRTPLRVGLRWRDTVEVIQFRPKDTGEEGWQDFNGNEVIMWRPPGTLKDGDTVPVPPKKQ